LRKHFLQGQKSGKVSHLSAFLYFNRLNFRTLGSRTLGSSLVFCNNATYLRIM
jgi:hypothetical protein